MADSVSSLNINAIFYELLQNGELTNVSPDYTPLTSDAEALSRLENMARDFDCRLIYARDAIYLIADADNTFLGYSRSDLKSALKVSSDAAAYYLLMFIFLVMLHEFYGTDFGAGHKRDFIQLGKLMNKVDEALKQGRNNEEASQKTEADIPFSAMYAKYNALKSDNDNKRDRTTKRALYERLFKFLESQDLIYWLEKTEEVRPRARLDNLFDMLLRSDDGYSAVLKMVERIENA